MINTINPIFVFCFKLILLLIAVFGIHLLVLSYLNLPLFSNLILASYSVNYLLAIIIFIALFKLKKKYLDILGFIFMGGSLLKFAVFFIFFFPNFNKNGSIDRLESASFLVPYLACLVLEAIYASKLLNNKL
ncbi:DUF6168 family protein [Lutibacter sp. A80]|uniref:DUF6168 family protein n=1 Tax=Lutibacter sp. A80 TaxID=2918453 RepID=UPI001F063737|nr:DUF6168 family protein [Lutibacter sp. A80]UMB59790.1 DUF6168 family protein [Lutibacter sp. A80]